MIGNIIAKIRKDKNISKTDVAHGVKIDVGHLTHIEKGERTPSHRTLKALCNYLQVPYGPIYNTYDKTLTEDNYLYDAPAHVKYDSIPLFNNMEKMVKCPPEFFNANFVLHISDPAMMPKININSLTYISYNTPLNNKDYGLFEINGALMIRKLIIRKSNLALRAENTSIEDIVITKDSNFYVIGKVLGITNIDGSNPVAF